MKTVQILGPSYSGTTVLGYILNTAPGWFFGSEVHRLLYSYMAKYGKSNRNIANPKCDFCGDACKYWTRELLLELKEEKVDSLQGIYETFGKYHEDISVFVDGSKKLEDFNDVASDYKVIAAKHPIRLLASRFYNKRNAFGVAGDSLKDVYKAIENNADGFLGHAEKELDFLHDAYSDIFSSAVDGALVKVDEVGFEEQQQKRICDILNLSVEDVSFDRFADYEVHSIGGNRAPYWARLERSTGRSIANPRNDYYKKAESSGDFKVDNKYMEVFCDDFIEKIEELKSYKELLSMLGYSRIGI